MIEDEIDLNINLIKKNRNEANKIKFKIYLFILIFFSVIVILIVILIYLFFPKKFYKFRGDEFIFFDPIEKNSNCNHNNYWTIYNNETSCFRFIILSINDSKKNSYLELLLDHNINYDNFTNALKTIKILKQKWKNYFDEIDLISQTTISKIMKLKIFPNLNENLTVNGGAELSRFTLNSEYYMNNINYNFKGFWSKDFYINDSNYVYSIDENGNNTLTHVSEKRGIRPVIKLDKNSILNDDIIYSSYFNNIIDITNILLNKNTSIFTFKPFEIKINDTEFIYRDLQGFTVVNSSKLIFYSNNSSNPFYGLTIETNFTHVVKEIYNYTGHGNGMTFDTRTNNVLLLGNLYDLWEFNSSNMNLIRVYNKNDGFGIYSGFGYDDVDDFYIGFIYKKIFFLHKKNFSVFYSFDSPMDQTTQDVEYYNGFVYVTCFDFCPNRYQLYCFNENYVATIYVYYAGFDVVDGELKPNKNFGRLNKILVVDKGIGEIESISFRDNFVYFGFDAVEYEKENVFKFFNFIVKNIKIF